MEKKKHHIVWVTIALLLIVSVVSAQQPLGTAFTYQGQLKKTDIPINDAVDFQFTLWDALTDGVQVGVVDTHPSVNVVNGVFTIELDFGSSAFTGDARWLEVTVTYPAGGLSETLSPREPITPAPYALHALNGGGLWTKEVSGISYDGEVTIGTDNTTADLKVFTEEGPAITALVAGEVGDGIVVSTVGVGSRALSATVLGEESYALEASAVNTDSIALYAIARGTDGRGIHATSSGSNGVTIMANARTDTQVAIEANATGTATLNGYPLPNTAGEFYATGSNGLGVFGRVDGHQAYGVYGKAEGSSGWGVFGESNSSSGIGVRGLNTATIGSAMGIYGSTNSSTGYSGYFNGGKVYISGRLGLGTSSPQSKLHVAGDSYFSGNVGIGTMTPTAAIDVSGNIVVSGTVDGRDIAADGDVLDSLYISGGADTTNDAWAGTTDVYTTAGNVAIGTNNADGYKLNVLSHSEGKAAVKGSDFEMMGILPFLYAEGRLGAFNPPSSTITPGHVGVWGKKTSLGEAGVGVYAWNADNEETNIAMYAVADGTSPSNGSNYGVYSVAINNGSGDNYGIYAKAEGGITNYAGYFDGKVEIAGSFHATRMITTDSDIHASGDISTDGMITASTITASTDGINALTGVTTSGTGRGIYGSSSGTTGYGGYFSATGEVGTGIYAEGTGMSSHAAVFKGNIKILSQSTGETVMELGEGLDYAEGFNVSDEELITAGTVLVIDPETPGKLKMCDEDYDLKVAGVVAGAKGLGSGVRLGAGQFDHDVALAGRVYCNVEAGKGGIKPGDQLTTSSTPGYAMKAGDHERSRGAILGKAMESLAAGESGQILILVTLQ